MNCLWKTIRSICSESRRISAGSTVALRRLSAAARAWSEVSALLQLFSRDAVFFVAFMISPFRRFTLAHLANPAFLALSLRCWLVSFAARAGPPFFPPLRPSSIAAAFFLAIIILYVSDHASRAKIGCLSKLDADATMESPSPPVMKCPICDTRKPRRHCPGVHGEICSICCGNEREVSISLPAGLPLSGGSAPA